jgi:predicted AAA+ superfamily ATPase
VRRGIENDFEYKEDYEYLFIGYHYFEKGQVKSNPKIVISLSGLLTRT